VAIRAVVKPNTYYDSVKLMTVSGDINNSPGVEAASVAMATPLNLDLLRDDGLMTPEVEIACPNDLVIAVRAESSDEAEAAVAKAMDLLSRKVAAGGAARSRRPNSIGEAIQTDRDLKLAIISVPGRFAGMAAEEALRAGLHVLLFSDNVPIPEEIRLKEIALGQGLLLMGPDCGTAIINGAGLGFANVVRRGPIGVVGASGTGTQEVTCLIDALGSGISQAIGTGGRDLSRDVGGLAMQQGIAVLGADESTKVLVLISKPPAPEVADRVLNGAAATGKPTVAIFLGDRTTQAPPGVTLVRTLTEAAERAVALVNGGAAAQALEFEPDQANALEQNSARLASNQRYVRGLFAGGTLCEEALMLLSERIGPVYSNIPLEPQFDLRDSARSHGNTLIDLGADEFTIGRVHPMIDPSLRNEWIRREAADPDVACLLLDVVLGWAAHPDPAGVLAPVLRDVRRQADANGRVLPVIISLCGTKGDPQGLTKQERALREAGAFVYLSNAAAALAAASIARRH
jgi:FdrA protein